MREAIGATWIFGIVIVFITLFSGYLAFSVNYSKAFKVKDKIVETLQKYNGPNDESIEEIETYLSDVGYNSTGVCNANAGIRTDMKFIGADETEVRTRNANDEGKYNYCIQRISSSNTTSTGELSGGYYKVVVFFSLSLPIVNDLFHFNVSGETMNIYYPNDQYLAS